MQKKALITQTFRSGDNQSIFDAALRRRIRGLFQKDLRVSLSFS